MIKRISAFLITASLMLSAFSVMASAAEIEDNSVGADSSNSAGGDTSSAGSGSGCELKFNASGWKNFSTVYCHIWKRGGDPFYNWQTKKEKCKGSGSDWSYDISGLDLKSNEDYCVVFSTNINQQTFDATFSKACAGDTLKLTGNKIENPKDSEKKADEAVWEKNSGSYGPHLAFTSIGNIVGSKLCPHEKGTEVIGDWLPTYYKSQYVKPVEALAKAFPRFGIKTQDDIQTVYAYIISKKTGEDESAMKKILEDAFAKAYPSKKGVKIDEKKAESQAASIKANGGHVSSASSSGSAGTSSAGASSSGGSGYSGGSSDSSGTGPDGEEHTIFFILGGLILASGVSMLLLRKKSKV